MGDKSFLCGKFGTACKNVYFKTLQFSTNPCNYFHRLLFNNDTVLPPSSINNTLLPPPLVKSQCSLNPQHTTLLCLPNNTFNSFLSKYVKILPLENFLGLLTGFLIQLICVLVLKHFTARVECLNECFHPLASKVNRKVANIIW